MSGAEIRRMEVRDISVILEIQAASRESAQWSPSAYESFCNGRAGHAGWIAACDGCVVGFLAAREVAGEMEILNLAAFPAVRRHGIGSALLRHALSHAAENGVARVFLEVRASNVAAQQFYAAHGFVSTGIRKQYYHTPSDDALVLSRPIATLK